MNSVEILVKEHDNILAFLGAVKNACLNIIEGQEPDTGDFRKMIDFVRNYADGHHHGKLMYGRVQLFQRAGKICDLICGNTSGYTQKYCFSL